MNSINSVNTCGLYLTADDFRSHKLSYEVGCTNSTDKLKINDMFGSSTGYVVVHGQKHSFDKNSTYGYRDCHNKDYRFYDKSSYEILDTAAFFLYYQYRSEELTKGKGLVKVDEHFFSTKANGPIQKLTLDNLKNAFPDNDKFRYALDATFRSDKELMAYDQYLNVYKVKYIYSQSLK